MNIIKQKTSDIIGELVNGEDLSKLNSNDWLYVAIKLFKEFSIWPDIHHCSNKELTHKEAFLSYVISLSERR